MWWYTSLCFHTRSLCSAPLEYLIFASQTIFLAHPFWGWEYFLLYPLFSPWTNSFPEKELALCVLDPRYQTGSHGETAQSESVSTQKCPSCIFCLTNYSQSQTPKVCFKRTEEGLRLHLRRCFYLYLPASFYSFSHLRILQGKLELKGVLSLTSSEPQLLPKAVFPASLKPTPSHASLLFRVEGCSPPLCLTAFTAFSVLSCNKPRSPRVSSHISLGHTSLLKLGLSNFFSKGAIQKKQGWTMAEPGKDSPGRYPTQQPCAITSTAFAIHDWWKVRPYSFPKLGLIRRKMSERQSQ